MLGAYLAVLALRYTGSFWLAVPLAALGSLLLGFVLDALVFRRLMGRDHLDQVLATYGVILLLEEGVRALFGAAPQALGYRTRSRAPWRCRADCSTRRIGWRCWRPGSWWRGCLWLVIDRTRAGMWVRAGASNAPMLGALGIDVGLLFACVLGAGAMLAGVRGGGRGAVGQRRARHGRDGADPGVRGHRGGAASAPCGARLRRPLLVGLADTVGRALVTDGLRSVLTPSAARMAGPAMASMAVYVLMAVVLAFRPRGLLPARGRA